MKLEEWVSLFERAYGKRLLRGREKNDGLGEKLAIINKPNVVLILSNAIIQEVEGRIETIRKT